MPGVAPRRTIISVRLASMWRSSRLASQSVRQTSRSSSRAVLPDTHLQRFGVLFEVAAPEGGVSVVGGDQLIVDAIVGGEVCVGAASARDDGFLFACGELDRVAGGSACLNLGHGGLSCLLSVTRRERRKPWPP